MISKLKSGLSGFRFPVSGLGFTILGFRFRVQGVRKFKVHGAWFKGESLEGFRDRSYGFSNGCL